VRYASTWSSVVSLDRWLGDADWVYAPVEQPVTTARALAVTVHDLYAFERAIEGLPSRPPASLSWRVRMRRILDRARIIATVSQFTRSRLLELFTVPRPERIVVVGNGGAEGFSPHVRHEDNAILARYGLERDGFVLFPGSLTWRKGGDLFLEVARQCQRDGAGLRFLVIGRRHDSSLLARLERLKEQEPRLPIHLSGYVPRADLATLYRHAKAALFPSRYEGFGIPVVEALASGCPLIISAQPALVEVAAGHATIAGPEPAAMLEAILTTRRHDGVSSSTGHTWSRCAARLVEAMQASAC
jgi:alpha-1,3-rhamnosyl/mannosyltransferase